MEKVKHIPIQMLLIIRDYFKAKPIKKAYLFGSYSRNENTENSDIDILVELDKNVGLFQFANIQLELEKLLKKPIDLVSVNGLSPHIGKYINNDKVLIYERKNK